MWGKGNGPVVGRCNFAVEALLVVVLEDRPIVRLELEWEQVKGKKSAVSPEVGEGESVGGVDVSKVEVLPVLHVGKRSWVEKRGKDVGVGI